MTSSSIPFERLADLAEERLSPEERESLQALVASEYDVATLSWLERVFGLIRADATDNVDAPPALIAQAVDMFAPRVAPFSPPLRKRIPVVLHFDSLKQPQGLGVRSGHGTARQMLFNTDERDIDLRISRAGAQWVVAGQVLGPGESGLVELQGPMFVVRAAMNQLWEFVLPPVPPGEYKLTLIFGNTEVAIPSLQVGM